jgi:hypothetical protein
MDGPLEDCLYCDKKMAAEDLSLEHAVPQFLGGAHAPQKYKLRNVCKGCNNKLGLFVDGSFARSWFVTNALAEAARQLYIKTNDSQPIPLVCMGPVEIQGISLPDKYTCEYWIGPFGDSIFWIRLEDERLYWYSGGNPISNKNMESTAYLFVASKNLEQWEITQRSFLAAFKGKKIRVILGTKVSGGAPDQLGFDHPTDTDVQNLAAFRSALDSGQGFTASLIMNTKFDERFIGKVVLGVGYSLFGKLYLQTQNAVEARKVCFPKLKEEPGTLRGTSSLQQGVDAQHVQLVGYQGAIALIVMPVGTAYVLSVIINKSIGFTVELGPLELKSDSVDEHGYALLIFPFLRRSIELSVSDLIAHNTGAVLNTELSEIDQRIADSALFFQQIHAGTWEK